jgi:hypothetical protein
VFDFSHERLRELLVDDLARVRRPLLDRGLAEVLARRTAVLGQTSARAKALWALRVVRATPTAVRRDLLVR